MVEHRCGIAQLTGGPPERITRHDHAVDAACLGMKVRGLDLL
jgi:hypothetical protein